MTPISVVTVGVFDGFHLGHARVLDRARRRAGALGARILVLTFDPHPQSVLGGEPPLALCSTSRKLALLREAGADEVRVIRFDRALAAKDPHRFLADHVFPFARAVWMVVGYDFAMGRSRAGTPDRMGELGRSLGFGVEAVDAARVDGEPVSSSRIRHLLRDGDVEGGARCLGRWYDLPGTVGTGDGRGRTLGFPTANLTVDPGRAVPARGVYAVRVTGPGLEGVPGVVNIGVRPTFGASSETVEAHLLDWSGDLAGERLTLEFGRRIRPEVKFNDPNELKERIGRDIVEARRFLTSGSPSHESA